MEASELVLRLVLQPNCNALHWVMVAAIVKLWSSRVGRHRQGPVFIGIGEGD